MLIVIYDADKKTDNTVDKREKTQDQTEKSEENGIQQKRTLSMTERETSVCSYKDSNKNG